MDGFNVEVGLRLGKKPPDAEPARVRSEVAREFFVPTTAANRRMPVNSRPRCSPLAAPPDFGSGLRPDLQPGEVRLGTLGGRPSRGFATDQAHDAAVADALAYMEREAPFTREGTDGARQVETRGVIATAFRHRDSRAGNPDLHTHVAVANKV